jgi:hypothetical protein
MKFLFSILSLALAASGASAAQQLTKLPDTVSTNSKLGEMIMANARQLENNNNNNNGEVDFTWVADFSIKFQGCHHISQWNDQADGEEDVRIATKRLVRFRLCPSNSCSLSSAGGCSEGYGDYVIDMNVYLAAYLESTQEYNEAKCEYLAAMSGCNNNGRKLDQADQADYCLYDYYAANGMAEVCADGNPYQNNYNGNDQQEEFDISQYTYCAQANLQNNNNGGRQLDQNQVEYYMGPYCAEQGGSIYLGLFTDDACTTFADDYGGKEMYYGLTGRELPYGETNMITMDCYSCMEPEAQYNYDGNDNQDADNVNEMCEMIYANAGKCESNLDVYGVYPNYNACSYIQGIQVIRKNGIIVSAGSKANKTASIFIGIFVVAFVLLSAYVYYLKTKLDRATISLEN